MLCGVLASLMLMLVSSRQRLHWFATARYALAIDELREGFEPTLWEAREGVD
ncbi:MULTISPECIES: DUF2235 domain-containing protein [unclassified Halomonas]|uniref:DUF2235 domain-containing protein n=1 Tax=unclassified Halomonas TaxID=2609666 RepID=UPI00209FD9C0|nr:MULTISPECIES: DUF2235 domain-containing protein [unclassified Halomonas]MCP1315981.1 DUF2235 domain-containing protein [Halomonas sp. 707D7]MCP1325199.1 DUF2235 domain-containing protein [Halomonas sp. 707D4]